MPLVTTEGTFLTSKEAAGELGMTYGTFCNKRTAQGDAFIRGHHGLIAGRVLYRIEDVSRVATGRGR